MNEREELALSILLYGRGTNGRFSVSMGVGIDPLGLTLPPRVVKPDPWWKRLGFLPPSDVMRAAEQAAQEPVMRHREQQISLPTSRYTGKRWDDPTITAEEIIQQLRDFGRPR